MEAKKPRLMAPDAAVETDQKTGKENPKELSSDSDSSIDQDNTADDSSSDFSFDSSSDSSTSSMPVEPQFFNLGPTSPECGGNESPKWQSTGIEDVFEISSPIGPMASMALSDEDTNQLKSPTNQDTRTLADTSAAKREFNEEPISDYEEDENGFSDPSYDSITTDDEEDEKSLFGMRFPTGDLAFRFAISKKKKSRAFDCYYSDEDEAASFETEFYEASDDQNPPETFIYNVFKSMETIKEYEQTFYSVFGMLRLVPSHLRYDIYQLMYPMLVLTYLQRVGNKLLDRAMKFLKNGGKYLDNTYKSRLAKLKEIQRPEQLPGRARILLNGLQKVEILMAHDAFMQCLHLLADWPFEQQEKILIHFRIRMYDSEKLPQQRSRLGHPMLDILLWTVKPGQPEERPTTSSSAAGSRDFAADTNANVLPRHQLRPPGVPSLKDEIKRRMDEQQREVLGRKDLPSVHIYTAMAGEEDIICADFSVKLDMVALGTNASLVHVFSVDASKPLEDMTLNTESSDKLVKRSLHGHQGTVYGCAFSPDDRYLLSCSDSDVRLWCLRSWNCLFICTGHQTTVNCVVFAPLGHVFAIGSKDGSARVWAQNLKKSERPFIGHLGTVDVCLFHPNSHYLATGSSDCTVRIWDILKGHPVRLLSGHMARICSLAFSKCGRFLASGGADNLVIVWDLPRERMIRCLRHHTAAINSCDFDMNNNLLVAGSRDGRLSVWDFDRLVQESGAHENSSSIPPAEELLLKSYANHEGPICKVSFTSGNRIFGVRLESSKKS